MQIIFYLSALLYFPSQSLHYFIRDIILGNFASFKFYYFHQVFILKGVSQVFSNKIAAAEDNLKNALKQLEKLGLEMEVNILIKYNQFL